MNVVVVVVVVRGGVETDNESFSLFSSVLSDVETSLTSAAISLPEVSSTFSSLLSLTPLLPVASTWVSAVEEDEFRLSFSKSRMSKSRQ